MQLYNIPDTTNNHVLINHGFEEVENMKKDFPLEKTE